MDNDNVYTSLCSLPMRVTMHKTEEGVPDGYIVDVVRDGVTATQIGVLFDDDVSSLSYCRLYECFSGSNAMHA